MPSGQDLIVMLSRLKSTIARDAPRELGKAMYDQTRANFRAQAYTNNGTPQPWKPQQAGGVRYRYPILRYKNVLFNSFKYDVVRYTPQDILISMGTDVPYAKVHNEGGQTDGSVMVRKQPYVSRGFKKHVMKVPKRQFMGIGMKTAAQFISILSKHTRKVLR
ncbi:MAG: phage virion morphogenesis protein [Oscillospiraceae bacterium]